MCTMKSSSISLFVLFGVLALSRGSLRSRCKVAQTCVTDVTDDDCGEGMVLKPNDNHIFGCCPRCEVDTGIPEPTPCPPTATCLSDGTFAPVQCKGDNFKGRCFCSDEHGKRIFGQMWRSEAKDMTCACSRRRAELEAAGRGDVTLHCSRNGDYELLQCDDGLCWCAQPKTGQPTVTPVMQQDMKLLPCYSQTQMGEQYLRRCESIVHALAVIQKEQSEHGTNFLGNPITFCDYDGSYGPYQILNNIAYCTARDGEILGPWQVVASEMVGTNCNCARDTMVYFPERGMSVSETCQANGNYQPNQMSGDFYYCVDSDGFPTTDFDTEWPADVCRSFA